MKKMMTRRFLLATLLFALPGCGSGGGIAASAPTRAAVKLSTQATGAAQAIGDITVTLNLPAGVSVRVKPDGSGQTADGVVVKSGAADVPNATALAKYSPAARTVDIEIVKSDGFNPGEFVTVSCDIAAGAAPVGADFSTSNFSSFDLTGNTITNLEVRHTVTLK